jgi:hypothetical protein
MEIPIAKTFQQLYCDRHGCALEKFEKKIFWSCLYPHAVPFAALLRWFDRDFFRRDFEYLYLIGLATDANEFRREVEALEFSGQLDDGAFRRLLRLRVSAERLMKLQATLNDHALSVCT